MSASRPTREAVSIAAATLGRRTLEPERLHALLSGKFVSALRSVASEMTMEQMHEQRGEYVAAGQGRRRRRRWRKTASSSNRSRSPTSTRPTSNSSIPRTVSTPRA